MMMIFFVALSFFPLDFLESPSHIDGNAFASFLQFKDKDQPPVRDVQFMGGDANPWRRSSDNSTITDEALIAELKKLKAAAEAEDKANGENAERLRGRGVRVDWLLALTIALDLWDWATWEVVQFLVKPATENSGR